MRERLTATLANLRRAQAEVLAPMPVLEIVEALDGVSRALETRVESMGSMGRRDGPTPGGGAPEGGAEAPCPAPSHTPTPPHPHTLQALLRSLRGDALVTLMVDELSDPAVLDGFRPRLSGGSQRALGPALGAHFFAGNTPLLSWPSLAAALLVKAASFGKLASADTFWPRLFAETLAEVHPDLGRCIALDVWPGGTQELDQLLCAEADAILAYGSDQALRSLRALAPVSTPFLSYGHRVSLGLVLAGADEAQAAEGLARDVLLYDQQGCLSAAMVFVEGDVGDAARVAEALAGALENRSLDWALPPREGDDAGRVRTAREVALFAEGGRAWGDPGLRWSVILDPSASPEPTCGACVVPVHPLPRLADLPARLSPLRAHLQGAALAGPPERLLEAAELLARAGISRICAPGELQAPPFSWHHDGRPVLASLVRWTDFD